MIEEETRLVVEKETVATQQDLDRKRATQYVNLAPCLATLPPPPPSIHY
jgi:hypothetical protein